MTKQERTIVNEAEEEAKKNRKKILGIFPRSKKTGSQPNSGSATPNTASTSANKTSGEYEYDDDDLPPREGDIGELNHPNQSNDSVNEDESVKGISKTAGFDFKAISRELGKEIDVDKLPARPEEVQPRVVPIVKVESIPPLERSGSAPPRSFGTEEIKEDARTITSARSGSVLSPRSFGGDGDDDDIGDIAGSTQQLSIHSASNLDLPSWGRSSPSSLQDRAESSSFQDRISPPLPSPSSSKTSSYGFNAWSQPSNPSVPTQPLRSAPPARPHPVEFLANPFAAEGGEADKKESSFGFGLGGWGKKNDDPWSSGKKNSSSRQEEEHNPW
jgi:hypothetical protein